MKCFHVTTDRGHVYGVAATTRRDALAMTAERLAGELDGSEPAGDAPRSAVLVGGWSAPYGTVLAY